jgi:molybdate/tungstate transport system permease protein
MAGIFHGHPAAAVEGVLGGAVMMWARGINEFGAVIIPAYYPKIVPVLIFKRFEGFGLDAAQPIFLLLILVTLVECISLRLALLPEHE